MTAMRKLIAVETKVLFRDWGALIFGVLFPAVLLIILANVFPGFMDPSEDLNGGRAVDLYTPIMLVFVLVMTGVGVISASLVTYRHDGILRRMRTTPIAPGQLLAAHLVAHLVMTVLGIVLGIVAAMTLLSVPGPANWLHTIVALLLAAGAMFSIGLVFGAIVPSPSVSQLVSGVGWLPIMVLAGLWFPREVMPETMRRISDFSPGGAAVDAVQQAWFGTGAPMSSLLVMVGFTIVAGLIAAVTFRWD